MMRKRIIPAVLLFLISIIAFVSCNDSVSVSAPVEVEKGPITSILQEDYGTREYLINKLRLYSIYNDYERTESTIKADISSYLNTFHGSSDGTKALPDYMEPEMILMESFPVTEDGSIRLEVYDIIDQNDNRCFIIIPTDKRIGDFLYLSDGGSWETAKDVEIIQEMLKSMLLYSKDVIELSNSLETTSGTKSISIKSHITVEDNTSVTIPTVNWSQEHDFNDAIEAFYGKNYPVGCGAVGIGIIMAHWKQPAQFIDIDFYQGDNSKVTLSALKSKWNVLSTWNGQYDWNSILAENEYGRYQRAALLLDIADACDSIYSLEGTGTYIDSYVACFDHFGFNWEYYENAVKDETTIFPLVKSLENNRPVLMSGYGIKGGKTVGHTFVIDGAEMTTETRKQYSIDEDSFSYMNLTEIQSLKYHANLGWYDVNQNGWYNPDSVASEYGFSCEFCFIDIYPKD